MTFLLMAIVAAAVIGYVHGVDVERQRGADIRVADVDAAFERGRKVGGDELADEVTRSALAQPDFIDLAWPRARVEGRLQ